MVVSSGKPYHEFDLQCNEKLRLFYEGVSEEDLVWHRDLKTRHVSVMDGEGWKLQMDNEQPLELKIGDKHTIPKMVYHRLIKGTGNLVLRIREL